MKKFAASSIAFLFLFGCASATVIKSNPPGAKLSLEGSQKGETPYTHEDRSIAGTTRAVTLKKEGYKDFNGRIKRSELDVGALIGGIFLTIPLLWIMKYPSEYTFEMEKLEGKVSDLPTKPKVAPPEKSVTTTPATPSPGGANIIITVRWTSANIRTGAGNEFPVVTTVKQGDKLTVIGESGDWFNVRLENGQEGWISNRVVK